MKNGIENLKAPTNEAAIVPLSFPSRLHAITVPGGCQADVAALAGGGPSIVQPALYPAGAAFFASERASERACSTRRRIPHFAYAAGYFDNEVAA